LMQNLLPVVASVRMMGIIVLPRDFWVVPGIVKVTVLPVFVVLRGGRCCSGIDS